MVSCWMPIGCLLLPGNKAEWGDYRVESERHKRWKITEHKDTWQPYYWNLWCQHLVWVIVSAPNINDGLNVSWRGSPDSPYKVFYFTRYGLFVPHVLCWKSWLSQSGVRAISGFFLKVMTTTAILALAGVHFVLVFIHGFNFLSADSLWAKLHTGDFLSWLRELSTLQLLKTHREHKQFRKISIDLTACPAFRKWDANIETCHKFRKKLIMSYKHTNGEKSLEILVVAICSSLPHL